MRQSRGAAAENCVAVEDTDCAAPTHPDGAVASEWDDTAGDCAAMGVSLSTVNRAHMAYDHGGIKALKPKLNGGSKHENMTLAEEKPLLARFARAAGAGEMLNIYDLKAAYEKANAECRCVRCRQNLSNPDGAGSVSTRFPLSFGPGSRGPGSQDIGCSPIREAGDRWKFEVAADLLLRAHLTYGELLNGEILYTYIRDPMTGEILQLDPAGWTPRARSSTPLTVPDLFHRVSFPVRRNAPGCWWINGRRDEGAPLI
jgi:hypothetical protein